MPLKVKYSYILSRIRPNSLCKRIKSQNITELRKNPRGLVWNPTNFQVSASEEKMKNCSPSKASGYVKKFSSNLIACNNGLYVELEDIILFLPTGTLYLDIEYLK